jgi:hypothetical protein
MTLSTSNVNSCNNLFYLVQGNTNLEGQDNVLLYSKCIKETNSQIDKIFNSAMAFKEKNEFEFYRVLQVTRTMLPLNDKTFAQLVNILRVLSDYNEQNKNREDIQGVLLTAMYLINTQAFVALAKINCNIVRLSFGKIIPNLCKHELFFEAYHASNTIQSLIPSDFFISPAVVKSLCLRRMIKMLFQSRLAALIANAACTTPPDANKFSKDFLLQVLRLTNEIPQDMFRQATCGHLVKELCKKELFDQAIPFMNKISPSNTERYDKALSNIFKPLCEKKCFEQALELMNKIPSEYTRKKAFSCISKGADENLRYINDLLHPFAPFKDG